MIALPSLKRLTQRIPSVQHGQSLGDVMRIFTRYPAIRAIVVLDGDFPLGVICRDLIADVAGLPCYSAWIDREGCLQFVSHPACLLCVDADAADLAQVLAPATYWHPAEPVVVVADGVYLGIVEREALIGAIAAEQQRTLDVMSRLVSKLATDRGSKIKH